MEMDKMPSQLAAPIPARHNFYISRFAQGAIIVMVFSRLALELEELSRADAKRELNCRH
jgi:hypothetical protein